MAGIGEKGEAVRKVSRDRFADDEGQRKDHRSAHLVVGHICGRVRVGMIVRHGAMIV
jgi:hypothetical protein